jgi:thiosulfate/3-mercaptopyruvate sulfurtransferase
MRRIATSVVAVLALAAAARAQEPDRGDAKVTHNRGIVVSSEWLAARLDSGVVVVHVGRSDSAFRAGHIPGARFLPLAAVAAPVGGVPNEFPPAGRLAATFRDLGIGDRSRVVLYGDDPGLLAARAWVALDLLGQGGRASVLDGGMARWRAGNRPVESAVRAVTPQPFAARWQRDRVVNAAWVRAHLRDSAVAFVDARPADQFSGAAEPACPPAPAECHQLPPARRGHLPRAGNVFWMDQLVPAENSVFRTMHYLHEVLWVPAGADRAPVKTVVVYCRTGMQASHAYLAARYIGYHDVRIYDGSMFDWAYLPAAQHPLVTGQP